MQAGERQVAPTRDGIRRDHLARYEWAANYLGGTGFRVVDVACGVGYGTQILAERGSHVTGYDRDVEALNYAVKHYSHPRATFHEADAADAIDIAHFGAAEVEAAVCFETIEHLEDPRPLLKALREASPLLLASVPNEAVLPFGNGFQFHHRHYTAGQFRALLEETGWRVCEWHQQLDVESEVERHQTGAPFTGRTLVAVAKRIEAVVDSGTTVVPSDNKIPQIAEEAQTSAPLVINPDAIPKHVAIVAMGPTAGAFLETAKRIGGRRRFCDEVWGINVMGDVFACDLVFHMDDVRIQEIRTKAKPSTNIAAMLKWLKTYPGPVYTSRVHPEYPCLLEYPLEAVVNATGAPLYFNNTAAYAVAYAVYIGVKKITMFGCDYTYQDSHAAERGRACTEFWLGIAKARGIRIATADKSTLLDACVPESERYYGYDTLDIRQTQKPGEALKLEFTEREVLPTAEDIEHRYDHNQHPNLLMADQ